MSLYPGVSQSKQIPVESSCCRMRWFLLWADYFLQVLDEMPRFGEFLSGYPMKTQKLGRKVRKVGLHLS